MQNSINSYAVKSLVLAMAIASIGCGQGFKTSGASADNTSSMNSSTSSGSNSTSSVSTTAATLAQQVSKVQLATIDAQSAIADASTALSGLTDSSGKINLSTLESAASTVLTGGSLNPLNPLLTKMQADFDLAYTKAEAVKTQFDATKTSLTSAIAQIQATNPTEASVIADLNSELLKVAALETEFTNEVHALASKMSLASTAIDAAVTLATSKIPDGFGAIAGFAIDTLVVNDVKTMLADFQAKMLAF